MIAVVADMLYLNQANDPVCGPLEITKVGEQGGGERRKTSSNLRPEKNIWRVKNLKGKKNKNEKAEKRSNFYDWNVGKVASGGIIFGIIWQLSWI